MEELNQRPDLLCEPDFAALSGFELVAEGGMSTIYKAHEPLLDRMIAIKILKTGGTIDPGQLSRFEQEARTLGRLEHPNIVPVRRYGLLASGVPYMIMDYKAGMDLRRFMNTKVIAGKDFIDIFTQVLLALAAAHKRGIIHRDVKPENILISPPARESCAAAQPAKTTTSFCYQVFLLDFGVAKIVKDLSSDAATASGKITGTARYMSPEQLSAAPLRANTDIYSLSCVMFEVIFGFVPFDAQNAAEIMNARCHEDAEAIFQKSLPAAIAPAMKRLLLKGLARNAEERFQTADELLGALDGLSSTDLQWRRRNEATMKLAGKKFVWPAAGLLACSIVSFTAISRLPLLWKPKQPELHLHTSESVIKELLQRGEALKNQQKLEEAADVYQKAFEFAHANKNVLDEVSSLKELGFLQLSIHRAKEAVLSFKRVVELSKRFISTNRLNYECREWLAIAYAQDGRLSDAVAAMSEAVALREARHSGSSYRTVLEDRIHIAEWLFLLHESAKAEEMLAKDWEFIQAFPEQDCQCDDINILLSVADLAYRFGNRERSRQELMRLADRIPVLLAHTGKEELVGKKVYERVASTYSKWGLQEQGHKFLRLSALAKSGIAH